MTTIPTVRAQLRSDAFRAADGPPAWLTAQVRPAGSFGRGDVRRLQRLLDALSASASVVVLDLAAARLRSPRVAAVIDDAARRLEATGGCLLCLNADPESAARLSRCCHAVVMPPG
ncbi:hypothetical protein Q6346_10540 [Isoptericola sp. b490]|uniref:hypothetical protein n=1 Tax=Actinotalea lenta TaxID=3064654 RepID=UPI002712D538|nr:hypothetical protein [Isoptericola sp. b490]MDO8121747.1 hypothetical protein [Isoptericola sp. b490]